ncbi:MAG: coenzyme F420-0:L-glutamate ligase [Alphaproteobacteria bacterium]|nr:coenzyme F420-0:L-glutamate ligase [Alphaproteobacteria bacterium]
MLTLTGIPGVPLVKPGDDLGGLLAAALERAGRAPVDRDVIVVAQKVVSKAEDRFVDLARVKPSARAMELAAELEKDPRIVEVVLSESRRVVRKRPGLLIVEHRLGFVMANGGVDRSNVGPVEEGERVLLLPRDPDASAERLRQQLSRQFRCDLAVIINDSFGRPWRKGIVGVALGAAGIPSLMDMRGRPDLFGRPLEVTVTCFADEISAAASLVMGQAGDGIPAVLVHGLDWSAPPTQASYLVRGAEEDLFR